MTVDVSSQASNLRTSLEIHSGEKTNKKPMWQCIFSTIPFGDLTNTVSFHCLGKTIWGGVLKYRAEK